jgi:hypothetical protein
MMQSQHSEAPSQLYCDRMDDKKKCQNCNRGTHLRFRLPNYPDPIAYYWKCRRCLSQEEKHAKDYMIFKDRFHLNERIYRQYLKLRTEAGELTD